MFKCMDPEGKVAYLDRPCASPKETQKIMTTSADKEELDPVLASIKIASTAYMLEKMEAWCAAKAPSTISAVKQTRRVWRQRHEAIGVKAAHILQTRLPYDERLNIATRFKLTQDEIIAKLEDASPSEHQQWCEGMPAKMMAYQMDMMGHRTLVKTIMDYTDR